MLQVETRQAVQVPPEKQFRNWLKAGCLRRLIVGDRLQNFQQDQNIVRVKLFSGAQPHT